MLVLARTRDETIMIGDDVEVTVVDVRGEKVRLGISAPRNVSVHRKEVYEAIRKENREAGKIARADVAHLPQSKEGPAMPSARPETIDREAHAPFIRAALDEARQGLAEGGLPIGSVLVRDGQLVARGHNRRVQKGDPMAHAEIDCLTKAGRQKTYRDTVLYSTLMPCYLCSGASVQFSIPKVVVGESVNFAGAPDFMRSKGIDVIDLHDEACVRLMSDFIQAHPDLWHEDIGK
ncbi:MAG: CMP/dCMP deaminase zinc-binding [Phycisphaerales bacterium]|nr:CMP/dCMP deaminase zinc-binding [Phycisphaerales bacterium]